MYNRYIRLLELVISVYVLVAVISGAAENRCQFLCNSTDSELHYIQI